MGHGVVGARGGYGIIHGRIIVAAPYGNEWVYGLQESMQVNGIRIF